MVSTTGLAYTLVVLLVILLLVSIVQLIQTAQVIRRQRAGTLAAPKQAVILLAIGVVALTLAYIFDLSVTSLLLVEQSVVPPPSGAHLALIVITTFLSQGLAPCLIFAAAFIITESRLELSGLETKDVSMVKRKQWSKWTEIFFLFSLPILIAAYLGIFTKAVLDTPTTATQYYKWLNFGNYVYRAALVVHALLFRGLAYRAISFHLISKSQSTVDPIMRSSILYHLTSAMFLRTIAVFVFAPLASTYATAKTPASATALLLAFTFFIGFSTAAAAQSLIGAARRPSSEWSPSKTVGEREVAEGEVPEDNAPPTDSGGKKHRRANSIPLSPTNGSFGPVIRVQEESTSN